MRWCVEVPRGDRSLTEDVGGAALEIKDSGLLVFTDDNGGLVIAYAPAAWLTVVEAGYE